MFFKPQADRPSTPTFRPSARPRRAKIQIRVAEPGRALRDKLTAAVVTQNYAQAVVCLEQLQQEEPNQGRWPHKRGDMWRLMRRPHEAFLAYASAVRIYAEQGQRNLAVAMAKTAITVAPDCRAWVAQLDPNVRAIFEAAGCSAPSVSSLVLDTMFPHRDVLAANVG